MRIWKDLTVTKFTSLNSTATPKTGADKSQKIKAAFEELLRLTENNSGNISNSSVLAYLWENEESRNTLQDAGVDAANVRASLEADPDGTWSIDDYIKEFSTPTPGVITYLCIKRGDVTDGITNVALVFGENPTLISQAALGEDNVELLRLPFENMAIAFTRINNGSAIMDDSMMQSIGDDAFTTTDEDSDAAYIQRAEEEAAQRKILEEKQRANQREFSSAAFVGGRRRK